MKLNDIFPAMAGAATFMIEAAQAKKKKNENRTGSTKCHCAKFIVSTHSPSTSKAVTYNLAFVVIPDWIHVIPSRIKRLGRICG